VRLTGPRPGGKVTAANPWEVWGLVILGALLLSVASVWFMVSARRQKRVAASLPADISSFDLTPSEAVSLPLVTDFDPDRNPFR